MTLETNSETELDELEVKLGVTFTNRNLLKQALTHESFINEWADEHVAAPMSSYERLEFLGDAVLNFAVANALFERSDDASEGELSMGRANIVCKDSLAQAAGNLDLGDYILRGKGETVYSPNVRESVLEDSFEAIIGAIHVDQGLDAALRFVFTHLGHQIEHVAKHGVEKDPKSAFQELVQGAGLKTPRYQTELTSINENGEHRYLARVTVGGREVANGVGMSKSKAQKRAAAKANELFSKGIPVAFAQMAPKSRQSSRTARSSADYVASKPSDRSRSEGWRRFGNWLGLHAFRKREETPSRRLIYRRSD